MQLIDEDAEFRAVSVGYRETYDITLEIMKPPQIRDVILRYDVASIQGLEITVGHQNPLVAEFTIAYLGCHPSVADNELVFPFV